MINIRDHFTEEEIKVMSLGDRMKWYEKAGNKATDKFTPNVDKDGNIVLDKTQPIIIRIDGKAFHTFTKGFEKPFDQHITGAMKYTLLKLCEEVQNVRVGYMQSDEISLIMTSHENPDAEPWFGGKVDKIVSISASIASAHFNNYMAKMYWNPMIMAAEIVGDAPRTRLAVFDARTWNVPMEEANNVFVWRQQDAERNSVSALAQSKFSHKELHGVNVKQMREMLLNEGIDWSELPSVLQRGFAASKESYEKEGAQRSRWIVEEDTPVFSSVKGFVNQYVEVPQ